MKIWIDADACPREAKELVFKAAGRLNIQVIMVANSFMNFPITPLIKFVHVDQGAITGGPAPYGPNDRQRFANNLNAILSKRT